MDISVVIPIYNEAASISQLYEEIVGVMGLLKKSYEIIFIDDGSIDESFKILENISKKAKGAGIKLTCLRFRKNFGKSGALLAGFRETKGDIVITMDGDLQDDPHEIPHFLERINQGCDFISGWKVVRKDPLSKVIPSKIFNFTTSFITGINLHDFNCGFKCYKKEVIKEIKIYGELYRYIPVLVAWRGFKIGEMKVGHRPRKFGKSKFGIKRFAKGFVDFITIMFLTKYAGRPLHFFGISGLLLSTAGFLVCVYLSFIWFMGQKPIGNRPLLLFGVLLILSGIQFISIGLMGELITNSSHRDEDLYLVAEKISYRDNINE